MTKLYGHRTTGMLVVVAMAACLLGTASTAWAQNRHPGRNLAAEAQLRALIAQLNAQTAAALAAQQRAQSAPRQGNHAAVLGGNYSPVATGAPSAADIMAGRYIGGTPSTVGGLNPNTAATLNKFAPGLVDQFMGSGYRNNQIWLAPTCVRGQYCW